MIPMRSERRLAAEWSISPWVRWAGCLPAAVSASYCYQAVAPNEEVIGYQRCPAGSPHAQWVFSIPKMLRPEDETSRCDIRRPRLSRNAERRAVLSSLSVEAKVESHRFAGGRPESGAAPLGRWRASVARSRANRSRRSREPSNFLVFRHRPPRARCAPPIARTHDFGRLSRAIFSPWNAATPRGDPYRKAVVVEDSDVSLVESERG